MATSHTKPYEMTRPEQRKLAKRFVALMESIGAVRRTFDDHITPEHRPIEYDLKTTLGPLRLSMSPESIHGPGCHGDAILGRFEDSLRASLAILHVNPHSGKWNHHYGRVAADLAIASFDAELRPILETNR